MELGFSFEDICATLSRSARLPAAWVREQIAMDDEILAADPSPIPHITPERWHQEWQRRHPKRTLTKTTRSRLDRLYHAYAEFLQSVPNLCGSTKQ